MIYWCECGAEPEIFSGNKVKYCPICGRQTLHRRIKETKQVEKERYEETKEFYRSLYS